MSRTVITIPATKPINISDFKEDKNKRVAAYARVSTDLEEQQTSYTAQVKYYQEYIKGRTDWEYVGIYTDEGITGTNTKKREGFKKMIQDALNGKIDLIITKSVSRFARNTVDSLTAIRQLKEAGVEVFFEKENIYTFDGKGEVMLTIMASLAQEESRSISQNTTWGQRKRFADGKVSVPYSRFLGYDRGENGELVINPEQAKVVKEIFYLFLQGNTYKGIARILMEKGYPTVTGQNKWRDVTIKNILLNEKYKGDALLQKSYVSDFLTKNRKKNNGEIPQYYVESNHEAIIEPILFDEVQEEIKRRSQYPMRGDQKVFTGKIVCSDCGHLFGSKTWHSTSKYKKIIWQCNHKYKGNKKCLTPSLNEEEIKNAFIHAFNDLIQKRETVVDFLKETINECLSTGELEKQLIKTREKSEEIFSKGKELFKNKGPNFLLKYEQIEAEYDEKVKDIENIEIEIRNRRARAARLMGFLELIRTQELISEFNKDLFTGVVKNATVNENKEICFRFKDGTEITVSA